MARLRLRVWGSAAVLGMRHGEKQASSFLSENTSDLWLLSEGRKPAGECALAAGVTGHGECRQPVLQGLSQGHLAKSSGFSENNYFGLSSQFTRGNNFL